MDTDIPTAGHRIQAHATSAPNVPDKVNDEDHGDGAKVSHVASSEPVPLGLEQRRYGQAKSLMADIKKGKRFVIVLSDCGRDGELFRAYGWEEVGD